MLHRSRAHVDWREPSVLLPALLPDLGAERGDWGVSASSPASELLEAALGESSGRPSAEGDGGWKNVLAFEGHPPLARAASARGDGGWIF